MENLNWQEKSALFSKLSKVYKFKAKIFDTLSKVLNKDSERINLKQFNGTLIINNIINFGSNNTNTQQNIDGCRRL